MTDPAFRKIDCLRLPVRDLDAALDFYREALSHELIWRSATAVGLRLPETDAELVLYTDGTRIETDLLVHDVAPPLNGSRRPAQRLCAARSRSRLAAARSCATRSTTRS